MPTVLSCCADVLTSHSPNPPPPPHTPDEPSPPSLLHIWQGFDEYMNLVLDEAEELSVKRQTRKQLGRILLKGDNITLMQAAK